MNYWGDIQKRFWGQKTGIVGAIMLSIFILIALYAPLLASSKPLVVCYDGNWYFPLVRYYFSSVFFSKGLDLFFNILGVALPFLLFLMLVWKYSRWIVYLITIKKVLILFSIFGFLFILNPAGEKELSIARKNAWDETLKDQDDFQASQRPRYPFPSFAFEQQHINQYAKLNQVLAAYEIEQQHNRILRRIQEDGKNPPYTLFYVNAIREQEQLTALEEKIKNGLSDYERSAKEEKELRSRPHTKEELQPIVKKNQRFEELQNRLQYMQDKNHWIEEQKKKISSIVMPLIRPLHWEDDAGGDQALNLRLPFIELSRLNRQDLMAALIFGTRISLFVGFAATALSLSIGIPLGLVSGFYGGRTDIILCRLVEVWESMPAFFMLLLIVTLLQTKSIFLIITVIAIFSWTSSFRFVRAETLRQREMLYVDACHALGFSDVRILFGHLLPNALVPVIALLPFDMMSAITREAGLAFLGLGEEQSCSWGELMDEGRAAFPVESALLWPPAIALTLLLIAIAFVGDALMNAMDPKAKRC